MNCLICRQAELVDGLTSVLFEHGEMRLMVERVPARICPNCGDACVEETVALRLLQGAEVMSATGIMEDVRQFESL
jgi:YgiT-type zinc finger domain-containing protein